jgi:hypothetical protein
VAKKWSPTSKKKRQAFKMARTFYKNALVVGEAKPPKNIVGGGS